MPLIKVHTNSKVKMRKTDNPLYERYIKPIDMSTQGYIFPSLPAPYDYVLNPGSKDTYHIEIVLPEDIVFTKVLTNDDIQRIKATPLKPVKPVQSVKPVRTRSIEVPVLAPAKPIRSREVPGPTNFLAAPGPTNFLEAPGPRIKPIRG